MSNANRAVIETKLAVKRLNTFKFAQIDYILTDFAMIIYWCVSYANRAVNEQNPAVKRLNTFKPAPIDCILTVLAIIPIGSGY